MFSVKKELLAFAMIGAIAGAATGWPDGWLIVQFALLPLFWRLSCSEIPPPVAASCLGVFTGSFYAAGQLGAALSIAADQRVWALIIWFCVSAGHGLLAALSGYAAGRSLTSPAARVLGMVPALWVLREWGSSQFDISIPWLTIGYAQAPHGPLVGTLPTGGVFMATWATLLLSAAVAVSLRSQGLKGRLGGAGLASAVVGLAATMGNIAWTAPSRQVTAELVQTGAHEESETQSDRVRSALRFHSRVIAASTAELTVFSQLSIEKTIEALPPAYVNGLERALASRDADALLGIYFKGASVNENFNGVQLFGSSGAQRYFKHHLFPFGEFLPFGASINRWVNSNLAQPRADTARGPADQEPLHAAGLRLAIAICYESAFGDTLRRRAGTADVLVNVASDSAHDSDQLARQFKQVDQARALELQKPLLRSSDVRGTFFIDASGQVSGELAHHQRGVSRQTVQGRSGLTPYARWGDAFVLSGVLSALLLCCLPALLANRRAADRVGVRKASTSSSRAVAKQRGQVLPMALALLVIVAGFFYLMVNAGQAVTEKMRVTNAADAAAYSAGVVEARALNYDAYLNRAMVANQMAIAQMVSFASWIDYFAKASDNFGSYATDLNFFLLPNPKVAVLDVAFAGSAIVAAYFGGSTVQQYADYVIDYGAGAIITVHDVATQALAASQRLVQLNLVAGIRQGQIADQVVKAMDPKLNAEVVLASHGFDSFTKNYTDDERARFADVAVRSRDLFTRERNFTLDSFDIPFIRKNPALKKRGGTDLIGLDEWRAVDTLELHGQSFGCGKIGLSWCDDIRTPIGWGGIEVDANGGDAGAGHHGNAYNENPTTAEKSDSVMRSPGYGFFSGIPTSQEISDVDPAREPSTGITIRVSKSQSDTLTSGNAAQAGPSGNLAVFGDHPAGGQIAALSRAQVFFDRIAARADGKSELGSLYNPYWRVRLVSPTAADRVYAASKQGGLVLPPPP